MSSITRTTFPAAQPPVKPTSTSYENACRHILGQRFRQLLQKAATLAAIVVPLSTLSLRFSLSWLLKNLIHIGLAFIFGVLPTLVARKIRRRALQTPRPKTLIAELWTISPLYVALYAISGFAVAECYATFMGTHVQGLKFSFFTGSNRYPWSVNERHVMLLAGNTILGVGFAALDSIQHRNPAWLRRFGGFTQRRSAATWKSISRSALLAIYYWPAFIAIYFIFRVPALLFFGKFFGFILRPFLHFMMRGGAFWQLVSWSLFWRMLVLQFTTLVMWDVAGEWFEINASQVIHLSQFKEDPNATLIAGLQSQNSYYKYFAFAELANVVSTRPPRRVALFSDLKANPTAWEQVCRECLLFLGKDYARVVARGGAPVAAPTPVPNAPTTMTKNSAISTDPVYKNPTQSAGPIDAFVGAANTVATVIPANLNVPAIFLPTPHPTTSAPASAPSVVPGWKISLPQMVDFGKLIDRLPPVWARRVRLVVQERKEAVLEGLLEGRAADVWIVEALSTLIAHSLQEDPYGRVQRDIPRVLEAFVSYLGALEQLIEEVNADLSPESEDAVRAVVQPVAEALREGIRTIVLEFGHRLKAFTFPPRVAKRLQTMVDYL
ncbi:nucleoporin protein Ndc1-Nup [Rhizoctonia solani]|nr:nucleoporin protein Ndc1-Nup [Rhizoctonia solani]